MKKDFWIFNILSLGTILLGQITEVSGQQLIGLTENQEIRKASLESATRKKTTAEKASLSLPFFDDFSTLTIYPDPARWDDNYAFINASFPDMPPSIGVATLDAIDATGNVYAIDNKTTPSDTLTSAGLNLLTYHGSSRKVILSFFYQAGGKGEVPDPKDSLVLEFYSAKSGQWLWAWKATADTTGPFQQHIHEIADSLYQDGFRFRFRNYTSMSPNETKGKYGALSNVDQWHLDYIRVDTNSIGNHANIYDMTLVEPLKDLLKQYETIPWNHVNFAQSIMRNNLRYVINVLDNKENTVNIPRSYFVTDYNQPKTYYYEVYPQELPCNEISIRNDPFMHPFTQNSTEYGKYVITAYISPAADQFRGNDTVRYTQLFKDYYSYDDGTAEFGIGISGESTTGAMMACRFPIFRQDTLRAVDIYFNKTRNQYTSTLGFNLCVWENQDGHPGDTLYVSGELNPKADAGLLEFARYRIPPDQDIIVQDTVFIGIRQLSEDFMNIGFDISHTNLKNVFFNTTGDWYDGDSISVEGTVMMRPVFGRNATPSGLNNPLLTSESLNLYPVPVNDILYIRYNGLQPAENARIELYDLSGRQVFSQLSGSSINVGSLDPGMYFLRLNLDNQQALSAKFIISR